MDQRKALFRSKLREAKQKQEKRIDSPLVRYNEFDQPICRVCNVTLKSESLWPAHQVSKKHHEAIENVRAAAAGGSRGSTSNHEQQAEVQKAKSSTVPANFFDNHGTKRQRSDDYSEERMHSSSFEPSHQNKEAAPVEHDLAGVPSKAKEIAGNKPPNQLDQAPKRTVETDVRKLKGTLPGNFFDNKEKSASPPPKENSTPGNIDSSKLKQGKKDLPVNFFDSKDHDDTMQSSQPGQVSTMANSSETKQVKGALPEGFFDNKDADLRARGIQPVKVDINDAYKEFEKEIQEDLQEVDDRLEEEEIDAAVEREEFLTLEQREYREKVDMVKKQIMESKAARNARVNNKPAAMDMESSDESSSDEDSDDIDFAVDWRAQHLK